MSETENDSRILTVTYELDAAHAEMYRQLADAGFDVSNIVAAESQVSAEQALYQIFQASKYQDE